MNAPNVNIVHDAEAKAVADVVRKHIEPRLIAIGHEVPNGPERQVMLIPNGLGVQSLRQLLNEYRTAPERRKGLAELSELDSFIYHVNRFRDADSALFADRDTDEPSLICVLDYHRAGAEGAPRFGEHRARYAFPISDEWRAWTSQNGKPMDQGAFALWIEDHLGTIADPASAGEGAKQFCALLSVQFASANKLLELSRGLSVHVGERVQNHVNLASGEGNVTFATSHADEQGKPIKVPGAFLLALQVFRGGALYLVPTRLRYRVQGGGITWSYDMWRSADVFDLAIGEACEKARTATELPLFYGKPE